MVAAHILLDIDAAVWTLLSSLSCQRLLRVLLLLFVTGRVGMRRSITAHADPLVTVPTIHVALIGTFSLATLSARVYAALGVEAGDEVG
jgi:hypothetical protein